MVGTPVSVLTLSGGAVSSPSPAVPSAPGSRLGGLGRLGAFCGRHPVWIIAVWLVLLVLALGGRHVVGPTFSNKISLPGSQSNQGADLLTASDPTAAAPNGKVVLHVGSGTVADHQSAVDQSVANLKALPHVKSVSAQTTSSDGRTAYSTVSFTVQLKTLGHGYTDQLDKATAPARADGVQVAYGGDFDQITVAPANDTASELVGVGAALLILLIAFGSVLASVLPLLTALIGVGVGIGVVGIVAGTVTFATAAPTLATMIGLGVGIDYALFLTTRFRQDLMDGHDPAGAAARTSESSGHAVIVAAITVAVALMSLYACGLSFIGKLGLAATIAVVITAIGRPHPGPGGPRAGRPADRPDQGARPPGRRERGRGRRLAPVRPDRLPAPGALPHRGGRTAAGVRDPDVLDAAGARGRRRQQEGHHQPYRVRLDHRRRGPRLRPRRQRHLHRRDRPARRHRLRRHRSATTSRTRCRAPPTSPRSARSSRARTASCWSAPSRPPARRSPPPPARCSTRSSTTPCPTPCTAPAPTATSPAPPRASSTSATPWPTGCRSSSASCWSPRSCC